MNSKQVPGGGSRHPHRCRAVDAIMRGDVRVFSLVSRDLKRATRRTRAFRLYTSRFAKIAFYRPTVKHRARRTPGVGEP